MRFRHVQLVIILISIPALAGAQDPELPDSARAEADSVRPRLLRPVIITGTRVPTSQWNIGFGSSVLDRRDLAIDPSGFATDVLRRLPGIAVDHGAGVNGPAVLKLRGGDEPFTQLLVDGMPINLSGGFLDVQGLTLTNIGRIEVARGPQSVMYGSSAIAGVVQLITQPGVVGAPRFHVTAEGGRATTDGAQARSELTVSGGSDVLRYSAGAAVTYDRGIYALSHDLLTNDGSLRLDFTPDPDWALTGTVRYMDISSNLPVRDPGVTRAPLDPNQRDGRQRLISTLRGSFAANSSWHHELTLGTYRDDFDYEDVADGLDPTTFPFFVFDFNFTFRSVLQRHFAEYSARHEFGGSSTALTLAYGARVEREDLVVEQGGDFGDETSMFDRENVAGFAEIQGRLGPRLHVIAGSRAERYVGLPTAVVPRLSAVFTVVPERLNVRGAIGRGFKVPNLQQQLLENPFTEPNPDLRPETSVSWEIGLTTRTADGQTTGAATFFRQRYLDLIRTVPTTDGTRQTNRNLGESRSLGVELELERWWGDTWRTRAHATWLRTEVVDNTGLSPDMFPNGHPLPATPNLTGTASVEFRPSTALSATLRGTVVGSQDVFTERFSGDRVELDPYVLLGATVGFQATTQLRLYVRAENLLDVDYQTAFDRPGIPPTAVIGIQFGG